MGGASLTVTLGIDCVGMFGILPNRVHASAESRRVYLNRITLRIEGDLLERHCSHVVVPKWATPNGYVKTAGLSLLLS